MVKQSKKENLLVFIAGGIGYNEISEVEKVATANCFYCSSTVFTPKQYLEQLASFASNP